jgi:hypothetical protein
MRLFMQERCHLCDHVYIVGTRRSLNDSIVHSNISIELPGELLCTDGDAWASHRRSGAGVDETTVVPGSPAASSELL